MWALTALTFATLAFAVLATAPPAGAQQTGGLTLTKTDSPDPVRPGQQVTYTITARNTSTNTVTSDVKLTDVLPAGTTFVSVSTDKGSCSYAAATRTVSCNLGNLQRAGTANSSATVTLVVTAPETEGTVTNTANATGARQNVSVAATAAQQTTVRNEADVALTKADRPDPVLNGGELTYTLTATNNGPDAANDVVIRDALPQNVEFVSAGPGCAYDPSARVVTCDLGTLADGASAEREVVVRPTVAGTLNNTATVTTSSRDPNAANNTGTATTRVEPAADLSITKEKAAPGPATFGQPFEYRLVVTNNGPNAAQNVVVSDDLPAGLSYNDGASSPQCGPVFPTTDPNDVRCTLASLAPDQSQAFTISVTPTRTGPVTNTATVRSSTGDPDQGNNGATTQNQVLGADLTIDKEGPATPVTAGGDFIYRLTVTNPAGGATAQNVVVRDNLPDGVAYRDADSSPQCDPISPTTDPNDVRCTLASLAPGESFTFELAVRAPAEPVELSNTGRVSSPTDPDESNNADTEQTPVTGSSDLAILKEGPADAADGSSFAYTLTVRNGGPSTAQNVVVSDALPAGVEFSSATTEKGTCAGPVPPDRVVRCDLGNVAPTGQDPITITIRVQARLLGPQANVASVDSDTPDPNERDNTSQVTTVVSPTADLALDKRAPEAVDERDPLSYTLVVTNNGPSAADSVVVRDTLPAGVSFEQASQGCTYDAGTGVVTCDLGSIASNGEARVTITVRANEPGESVNRAVVSSRTPDGAAANNEDDATTLVNAVNDPPVARDDLGSTNAAALVANAYVSQYASPKASSSTGLFRVDTSSSPFAYGKIGRSIPRPMNAVGYSSTDNSLYGYRLTNSPGVMRINPSTGAARYLGNPRGLPKTNKYIAGDVSPDGSTYYLYGQNPGILRVVNLSTFRATSVKLSSGVAVADLAVSPTNGKLYGVNDGGQLLEIDPDTGEVTIKSVPSLVPGGYGAAWFTADGDLIAYENGERATAGSGTLYQIENPTTATPSATNQGSGPYTVGNDGAAFVAAPDQAGLSVGVNVLENDVDPEGKLDPSTVRVLQPPDHGTAQVNPDGSITYTTDASYQGSDSFRYEVCDDDPAPQCAAATVRITAAQTPDAGGLSARRE